MTYLTLKEITDCLQALGYTRVSELLNTTNPNLYIGPSNLLTENKIEFAQIYTKPIYTAKDLSVVYPDHHSWSRNSSLKFIKNDCCTDAAKDCTTMPLSNHMVAVFQLGRSLTSHVGIVHGGASASIIDEYFVKVVLPLTANGFAVTANLSIKYLRPIKFQVHERIVDVILECFVTNVVDSRKFTVVGALMDKQGNKYCTAELLVVVPQKPL